MIWCYIEILLFIRFWVQKTLFYSQVAKNVFFTNRASAAIKNQATIESQFIEAQTALEEETKQKLALSSKLRQLEADKEALRDQLEEEEEAKRNYEKQIGVLTQQLTDAKKKAEDEAEQASILEESKKKLAKDLEMLQRQVEELTAANDKLEKSKKKIAAELEDVNIDLETQRSKVSRFSYYISVCI